MPKPIDGGVVKWTITVPKELSDAFDRVTWDPLYDRPRFGAKVEFVTKALQDFLRNDIPTAEEKSNQLLEKFHAP